MIAIGCAAYLSCGNKYIGALLFTVALCSICNLKLSLYTGMVCFATRFRDIRDVILCLFGNISGCFVTGCMIRHSFPNIAVRANKLLETKLSNTYLQMLFASILCGILIYIAVETFNAYTDANRFVGIFTCIPAFILCGFEHSVADIAYWVISEVPISSRVIVSTAIFIAGNGIGGLLFPCIVKEKGVKSDVHMS